VYAGVVLRFSPRNVDRSESLGCLTNLLWTTIFPRRVEGGGIYFVCFHFPFFSDPSPSLKKMRGVFLSFFFTFHFFCRFPFCFPVVLPYCDPRCNKPRCTTLSLGRSPRARWKNWWLRTWADLQKKYFQKIDLYIQNTDIFLIIAIKKIVKNIIVMVSDQ
jgi:hypothetical protein